MELRKVKKIEKEILFSTPITDNLSIEDVLIDADNNVEENVLNSISKELETKAFYNEVNKLETIDKKIVKSIIKGRKQHEIAKQENMSQANISRKLKRIKTNLKNILFA